MHSFIFIILSLIFYFSFFNRGLYFEKDLYGVHILVYGMYVILMLRFLMRKEKTNTTYFSFLFIIPLLYIIAISYAQFPLGAIHQSLKWMTFVSFFILLFWASYQTAWVKRWLPYIFQFTGLSISIHMYLNVLGIIESPTAFIFDRFAGVLQYPNTFGMVIGVFFVYSLILLTKRKLSLTEIIIYSLPLTIYVYMIVGTLSRGMFVVLPIILIITLLLRNIQSQLFIIGTAIVAAIFTGIEFLIPLNNLLKTGVLLLFSAVTVIAVYYFRELLFNKGLLQNQIKKRLYTLAIPIITLISGVLLILDLLFKGFVYRMLPATAQQLVDKLNESSTFRERMLFVQDSFELSKQSPIFGIGGEGFTSVYRSVQQLPYRSKRIHNELMEVLVDVGWFGLVLFAAVFGVLLYFLYINWKKGRNKTLHLAVFISLLQIFLHSLLDFNMQYAVTWFLVFWLLAMSLATETLWITEKLEQIYDKWKKTSYIVMYSATLFVIVGLIVSFNFTKAEQSFARAKQSHYIEDIREAAQKNPYKSDYLLEYGKALNQVEGDNREEIEQLAVQLAKLEPNNSYVLEKAGHLSTLANNYDAALEYYYDALTVDKYHKFVYEKTFDLLLRDESEENAEEVLRLFAEFEATYESFNNNPIGSAHNSREFELTDRMITQVAQAHYIGNDIDALGNIAELSLENEAVLLEVLAYKVLLLESNGEIDSVNDLMKTYDIDVQEFEETKKTIKKRLGRN